MAYEPDDNVGGIFPAPSRPTRLRCYLERELWPVVPAVALGQRLPKAEEERILGYGEDGV